MKSIYTRLSTMLLCGAFALVGCTDFSADLIDVNDKVDDLTETSATKDQVAELVEIVNDLQDKLNSQYATKLEVADVIATIEQVQAAYQKAVADLEDALEAKADQTALDEAVEELTDALTDAETVLNQKDTELEARIKALEEALAKLQQSTPETPETPENPGDNEEKPGDNEEKPGDNEEKPGDDVIVDNKAEIEALQKSFETLQQTVKDILADIAAVKESLKALDGITALEQRVKVLEDAVSGLNDLTTKLDNRITALEEYKKTIEAEFVNVNAEIKKLADDIKAIRESIENVTPTPDPEVLQRIADLENAMKEVNNSITALTGALNSKADKTEVEAAIDAANAATSSAIADLKNWVLSLNDEDTIYDDTKLVNAIEAAKNEYKNLVADLQSQIDALADAISNLKSELRNAVVVPEFMYNGMKAVKFQRLDGKNVLKTYATVSYHFNPSNFDIEKAEYEIVAHTAEVMTKAVFAEEPTISIIGKPVQKNGKVIFELERGKGEGNMFALKVTMEDGTIIYSDYAAIVDEATFAVATATSSFQVERLAFGFPTLASIADIIEFVQSIGTTIEDFESAIQSITAAVEAMQNNDITTAIENLIQIPGLQKETRTIYGKGVYKVQVETLDAKVIIEGLKNAQSIDELRKIISDLFAQAQGLGEAGSAIVDGLNSVIGGSGIDKLFGEYDSLKDTELPNLILDYNKAVGLLDQYQTELNNARKELDEIQDKMDAVVAGLDATKRAEIEALEKENEELQASIDAILGDLSPETKDEIAELEAKLEDAGVLQQATIKLKIAELMDVSLEDVGTYISAKTKISLNETKITAKAGANYLVYKTELKLKEAGYNTAQRLLDGAYDAAEAANQAVENAKAKLAELETRILNEVKTYILENTELGKYLTDLENALSEQAWEGQKSIAAGTAQLFAIDALIDNLIENYNAANQEVVDEFANSLFGRVAYLIQTKEAEEAFELIGLADLYPVVKQLPDLLTLVIRYYPAGVDITNFTNFNDFGTIFSDYLTDLIPETKVEWEKDYYLAK